MPRGLLKWTIHNVRADADAPVFIHCASVGSGVVEAKSMTDTRYLDVTAVDGSL